MSKDLTFGQITCLVGIASLCVSVGWGVKALLSDKIAKQTLDTVRNLPGTATEEEVSGAISAHIQARLSGNNYRNVGVGDYIKRIVFPTESRMSTKKSQLVILDAVLHDLDTVLPVVLKQQSPNILVRFRAGLHRQIHLHT